MEPLWKLVNRNPLFTRLFEHLFYKPTFGTAVAVIKNEDRRVRLWIPWNRCCTYNKKQVDNSFLLFVTSTSFFYILFRTKWLKTTCDELEAMPPIGFYHLGPPYLARGGSDFCAVTVALGAFKTVFGTTGCGVECKVPGSQANLSQSKLSSSQSIVTVCLMVGHNF